MDGTLFSAFGTTLHPHKAKIKSKDAHRLPIVFIFSFLSEILFRRFTPTHIFYLAPQGRLTDSQFFRCLLPASCHAAECCLYPDCLASDTSSSVRMTRISPISYFFSCKMGDQKRYCSHLSVLCFHYSLYVYPIVTKGGQECNRIDAFHTRRRFKRTRSLNHSL